MARKPRIEYEDALLHVIQRGNNKEFIFNTKEDKKYLLDIMSDVMKDDPFHLLGYVIMDNHYHLLIKLCKSKLYSIMHRINYKYSRYYNKKYDRTGHVFESRYKSILVADDRYLLSLLRYIHQNPVRANICVNVSDYYWSSDKFYRLNISGLVNTELLLGMFSQDRKNAIEQYKIFIEQDEPIKELREFFEGKEIICDIGTDIEEDIDKAVNDNDNNNDALISKELFINPDTISQHKISLDDILLGIGADKLDITMIKAGSRRRHLTDLKKDYILEAYKYGYSMKEITSNINISCEAAYKIIGRTCH